MKTLPIFSLVSCFALATLPSVSVRAAAWEYRDYPAADAQDASAGFIQSISSTYDSDTHILTWTAHLKTNNGVLANGFWLALDGKGANPGAPPSPIFDQLPVLYFDALNSFNVTGASTGIKPTLTAFGLNGQNFALSNEIPGVGLLSNLDAGYNWDAANVIYAAGNATDRFFGFSIDTSYLDNAAWVAQRYQDAGQDFNAANWEGAGFDDTIGLLFHPLDIAGSSYDDNTFLESLSWNSESAYEISCGATSMVPEPGSAMLVVIAGLSFLLRRRTRRG